jgi:hypothetical protein
MIPWDASGIVALIFSISGSIALLVFMLPFLRTRNWKPIHVLLILGHVICFVWNITGILDGYSQIMIAPNIRFSLGLVCVGIILQIHLELLKMFSVLSHIRKQTITRWETMAGALLMAFLFVAVSTTWNSWNSPWDEVPLTY